MSDPASGAEQVRRDWIGAIACIWLALVIIGLALNADVAVIPEWIIRPLMLSQDGAALAFRFQLFFLAALTGFAFTRNLPRRLALYAAFGWLAFTDLASWSGGAQRSAVVLTVPVAPWITGLLHVVWLVLLSRTSPRHARRFRLSPAWSIATWILVLTVAGGIGGRLDVRILNPVRALNSGAAAERIDLQDWIGRSFDSTSIAHSLPSLQSLPAAHQRIYLLIHPGCGRCLEAFDLYYNEFSAADLVVINIDPLPADSSEPKVSELMPSAREFTLPQDRLWIVDTPAILIVTDGVVTCAAAPDLEPCFNATSPGG